MKVRHLTNHRDAPPGHRIVRLTGGYYDLYRIHELRNELFDLIPLNGVVTIDLIFTQHIECACLGAMIKRLQELELSYGIVQMKLINVNTMLLRILTILGLNGKFIIG